MHQLHQDIVILFALSVVVIYLFHRIRIPAILGYLITGIVAGPYGFKLITSHHEVEQLAEVGVVLLLFTIGIEFSLSNLKRIKKVVFVGGGLQVLLCIAVTAAVFLAAGQSFNVSLFMGFLLALSSTAIVMKLINDRNEVVSPQGKITLGVLVFQDIIVVPMILAVPLLAGTSQSGGAGLIVAGKIVADLAVIFVLYRWGVPFILHRAANTRSNELFMLTVVLICIGIAYITSLAELSLALGAFLAGLIISESEYSHRAIGNIVPFRDLFTSFFFVSIGMLFNVGLVIDNAGLVLLLALAAMAVKFIVMACITFFLGYPLRIQILAGLYLSQVGEFSFVLAQAGYSAELLSQRYYQLFLAVSVLTMAVTPFLFILSHKLAAILEGIPLPKIIKYGRLTEEIVQEESMRDHMVIIGYGLNGRNVARAAEAAGISYCVLEMNPETVRRERAKGVPIYYGDAAQEEVLQHVGVHRARVVIIVIAAPEATRQITAAVRLMNKSAHLIIRTRFVRQMDALYELGANEVIPEEYETAVEIFARVLLHYQVPMKEIERLVGEVRTDGYGLFRLHGRSAINACQIPDVQIQSMRVEPHGPLAGKTLAELDLRKKYGITVLALRRGEDTISNPSPEEKFLSGDVVFLLADTDHIKVLIGTG
jgi:CPA2 family monovalent cation:H+ antiporter-2